MRRLLGSGINKAPHFPSVFDKWAVDLLNGCATGS